MTNRLRGAVLHFARRISDGKTMATHFARRALLSLFRVIGWWEEVVGPETSLLLLEVLFHLLGG